MNTKIFGKIGFLLIIVSYFFPLAMDMNGFRLAENSNEDFIKIFILLIPVLSLIGAIGGFFNNNGSKKLTLICLIISWVFALFLFIPFAEDGMGAGFYLMFTGLIIASIFCIVPDSHVYGEIEDRKNKFFRIIIGLCALVMCVMFFIAPIIGIEETKRGVTTLKTVTAWDFIIADEYDGDVMNFPVFILLLIFPVILMSIAFLVKSFKGISEAAILCVIIKIVYFVVYDMLKSSTDILLPSNWIILSVYIALSIFSICCIKGNKKPLSTP